MTRDELRSLYEATANETRAVLDQVADKGYFTFKPGSPSLAIFYAFDELFQLAIQTLIQKEERMRALADA